MNNKNHMITKKNLSKKEIEGVFTKMGVKKSKSKKQSISEWIKKIDTQASKKDALWIISDTTSSFINFNQNDYGKLEGHS